MKLTAGGVNYSQRTAEEQKAMDAYVKTLGIPPGPATQQGIYATPEFTGDPYPSDAPKPVEENQEPPEGWPRNPVFNKAGDVPGPPVQFGPPVQPTTVAAGEGFTGIGLPENDIFYFHPDHLGSTSYISNKNGSILQHVEYIAFGEILFEEHSSSFSSPYLFNGKELDRETNLSYFGARYLDMKTSLWLSVDPLSSHSNQINKSPYSSFWSNPIKYTDPDGKCPECPEGKEGGEYVSKGGETYKFNDGKWSREGGSLDEVVIKAKDPYEGTYFDKDNKGSGEYGPSTKLWSEDNKLMNGVSNTFFGVIGTIGAVLAIPETGGVSGLALTFTIGEISIGIAQIADSFSSQTNDVLHEYSTIPGLIAGQKGIKYAPLIDGVSGWIPGSLSGGNVKGTYDALSQLKDGQKIFYNSSSVYDAGLDANGLIEGINSGIETYKGK